MIPEAGPMSCVKLETIEGLSVVRFDDGKANVLNSTSLSALSEALEQARESKAVLLKGREGCFCGGLDLKTLPKLAPDELKATLRLFGEFCLKLLTFPRPVLAEVDGHAIAGGTVILLCCDARVGSDRPMKIGLSEVAIGMPLPTFVLRLAELTVPRAKILETVLHGKLYSSQGAREVGYLDTVVPQAELEAHCKERATALGALPNPAYQLTKERLLKSIDGSLDSFDQEMNFFFTAQAQAHASNF